MTSSNFDETALAILKRQGSRGMTIVLGVVSSQCNGSVEPSGYHHASCLLAGVTIITSRLGKPKGLAD